MLTFDTWSPKGEWWVALVELDANNNGVPDATEPGYDPYDASILVAISPDRWWGRGIVQRVSDVYSDDDYGLACWFGNAGNVQRIECNQLEYRDQPEPWRQRFTVVTSTWIPLEWGGFVAVYRDLVVWTDGRENSLSGYDIYIADLDADDDGILDHEEDPLPDPVFQVFPLVNRPWHQRYPDIWWPFAVWADQRNGNQQDVYAYDLSLDSDGDGVPNWKDPERWCNDPAEIRVTSNPAAQTGPETWGGTVVWDDHRNGNWDIYGATLQPVLPQPREPVTGTAEERALHWIDGQTQFFARVQDVPGYDAATGLVTRYGSSGIQAVYTPTTGTYAVGFDYCYFGTPDQKRYLGRFGRGFTYDQGLALIARSMISQPVQAGSLARYVSNYQNSGQQANLAPGSFGFSFNGRGHWGEKDNYYAMEYLRTGANAWFGYGLLYHGRQYPAYSQYTATITRVADYILSQQVLTPTDRRYGLFTGGFGHWISETLTGTEITWAATEHNIDAYFFLRDLGQATGDSRYIDAAELLRANMPKLWNEEKGRFNQGMEITGRPDTYDALDAASWGSMYWTAVGDLDKARRSLEYADRVYSATVTITDPALVIAPLKIWGYKAYSPEEDYVWSEGSLGVAMAYLKLGHAVAKCHPPAGEVYFQNARDILAEMEKLQSLDPEGGVMYAISEGGGIPNFPQAPSVAGTAWLLMLKRAMEDQAMRDALWGPDPGGLRCNVYLPTVLKQVP
jgi:beta propeller repeat protein